MALRNLILISLVGCAVCKPELRGAELQCSGSGSIPAGPVCYGGSLLTETFSIHVVSHDGEVGIVDMKAEGPQTAECEGANFENNDNVITIENDHGCGLTKYDYAVEYCPDQDNLIISMAKPYNVRVVLESQACPAAGEV
ncbi:unnamed protein product [Symbiodinium sp. CCMP2592]|nr:unnamed protein product [Symbiodinium sp. CCMP2592]